MDSSELSADIAKTIYETADQLFFLGVEYFDDVIQQLYVDESFIKMLDLDKFPIHSTIFKDDVAEEILSTVRPQCAKCVGEYLSKIGLKK